MIGRSVCHVIMCCLLLDGLSKQVCANHTILCRLTNQRLKLVKYYTAYALSNSSIMFTEYEWIVLWIFGLSCAVFCENKCYFWSHVLYDSPYDSDTCNVFEINVLNLQCFYVRECGFGIRRSLHCYIWQQQNVMKYINCHSTGSNLLRVYYLSWGKIYVYSDNIM